MIFDILGLIVTLVGTLSTSIGVYIAYKQLIQPTTVKIRIGGFVTQELDPPQSPIFHIRFFNNCIKTVFIEKIGYCIDDYFINFSNKYVKIIGDNNNFSLPYALSSKTFIDVSIDYNLLKRECKKIINCVLRDYKKSKISFAYIDCFNVRHNTKPLLIKDFFRIYDKIYESP